MCVKEKDFDQGFINGIVYAIAEIVRMGEDSIAEDLWNASGYVPNDVENCAEYDVKELRKFVVGVPKGIE